MSVTSWKKELKAALAENKETFEDVESITLTKDELEEKFNAGFGSSEGKQFTVWTKNKVYFPVVYDGSEWVGCVSRNPDGEPTHHWGGE